MKYRQLTKEQLEALSNEFATFLATQQIDKKEWDNLVTNKPNIAEEELNIFSDLVWDDVLTKATYIDHISENHLNLFSCKEDEIVRIYIKSMNDSFNFLDEKDFNEFVKNPLATNFSFFTGFKKYKNDRNLELFELIEMGGTISKGTLFIEISKLIPSLK